MVSKSHNLPFFIATPGDDGDHASPPKQSRSMGQVTIKRTINSGAASVKASASESSIAQVRPYIDISLQSLYIHVQSLS